MTHIENRALYREMIDAVAKYREHEYKVRECIRALVYAMGPVDLEHIKREVAEQVSPFVWGYTVTQEIDELIARRIICHYDGTTALYPY